MTYIAELNRTRHLAGLQPLSEAQTSKISSELNEAFIELDWALGNTPKEVEKLVKAAAEKEDLKAEIITMDGPGGGNPLVRFSGKKANIKKFLVTYCHGDETEADFMMNDIGHKQGTR